MKAVSLVKGVSFGVWYSRRHLVDSYVIIPAGIITIFCVLYGFNQLLANVAKIKFPASVLGMLVNLVWLTVLSVLANSLPTSWTRTRAGAGAVLEWYLYFVKPSMNFSLKWINVFFIPSFVILPLSDPISFIECLKIAGVFVGGFLILWVVDVYFVMGLRWAVAQGWRHDPKDEGEEMESLEPVKSTADITTIDLSSLRSAPPASTTPSNPFRTPSVFSVVVPTPEPAYHGSRHSSFTQATGDRPSIRRASGDVEAHPSENETDSSPSDTPNDSRTSTPAPQAHEADYMANLDADARRIAVFVTNYIDWLIYAVLFVVALPLYYVRSLHILMPYHLAITILAFYAALLIPQRWPVMKKFAHPIIVSTAIILFCCFIGSLIYHHHPKGFLDDLRYYKTGKNYSNLFNNQIMLNNGKQSQMPVDDPTAVPKWPGCGDWLSSLMDVSIVALSLPMFTHRRDFIHNFWFIMPPILVSCALTFFLYPLLCVHIGISPERSLGFVGRSVTLALGTPLVLALEGSVSLMAVCTILSGICGVLIGDTLFKLMRVKPDDYATRGVSMGINCGAIATAHLLNSDPRAASMSSLSFSVFGTTMVVLASITGVADVVRSWVGL
ncbi:hypothetical protein DICA1_E15632 [Diutina catenulata]